MVEFEEIIERQCHGNDIFEDDEWNDTSSEYEEEDDDEPSRNHCGSQVSFSKPSFRPLNGTRAPAFFQRCTLTAALQRSSAPNLHCF